MPLFYEESGERLAFPADFDAGCSTEIDIDDVLALATAEACKTYAKVLTADLNAAASGDHTIACFGTVLIHASADGKCTEMVQDLNQFVTVFTDTGRRGSGQSEFPEPL